VTEFDMLKDLFLVASKVTICDLKLIMPKKAILLQFMKATLLIMSESCEKNLEELDFGK